MLEDCRLITFSTLACRMYGVIPQESWDRRWENLKSILGNEFDFRQQCNLVKTLHDSEKIDLEIENDFFSRVRNVEKVIGVSEFVINAHDSEIGSYRNFHDHLLLEIFDMNTLEILTATKLTKPNDEEIELSTSIIREKIVEALK